MEGTRSPLCNPVANNQNAFGFLHEVDRALHDFLQWQNQFYRALVSEGTANPADLAEDAHARCAFGRWAATLPDDMRVKDAGLQDMLSAHEGMHAAARHLLVTRRNSQPIAAPAFDNFVGLAQDFKLTLLKYQRRIISEVCTLDPLTGAGNRYAMDLRLTEEWERARRSGLPCSLCLLDIDHFKHVNDAYGHAVGDVVLRTISRFLKGDGRIYDDIFRYGGEEFLICMPDTALDEAVPVFDRLRMGLAGLSIPLEQGEPLRMTASFGVALLLPDEPIEQSLERVDHALLCAKNGGRNRVCVWDMDATASPPGRQ